MKIIKDALSGFITLLGEGHDLYLGKGLTLWKKNVLNDSKEHIGTAYVSLPWQMASYSWKLQRACKLYFRELCKSPEGDLIGIVRKSIVLLKKDAACFRPVFTISKGGRPKAIEKTPKGQLFVGEYSLNPYRHEIRIWTSDRTCQYWDIAYVFHAGKIRHIHNIIWDPYRKGLLVLTGDREGECAILFSDDYFHTLTEIVRGGQVYRSCNVFCRPEGIYYATDSELEKNWIIFLNLHTGQTKKILSLPGSSIYANQMANHYFISTCVEPSKINNYQFATLWTSKNLQDWKKLIEFKKDLWPGKYFGFGNIILPRIEGKCFFITFSTIAVKGNDFKTFFIEDTEKL